MVDANFQEETISKGDVQKDKVKIKITIIRIILGSVGALSLGIFSMFAAMDVTLTASVYYSIVSIPLLSILAAFIMGLRRRMVWIFTFLLTLLIFSIGLISVIERGIVFILLLLFMPTIWGLFIGPVLLFFLLNSNVLGYYYFKNIKRVRIISIALIFVISLISIFYGRTL